jgi:hypothetical protein
MAAAAEIPDGAYFAAKNGVAPDEVTPIGGNSQIFGLY